MKRFYISDLDKTILNKNGELSIKSKEKIKLILKNNIDFTIATARSYNSVKQIFKGIDIQYPIIELNGTMLTDFKTEKHYTINTIDYKIIKNITNYAKSMSLYPFYTIMDMKNNERCNLYPPLIVNEGSQWFIDNRRINQDSRLIEKNIDLENIKDKSFLSMTFIYHYDEVFKLKEYIESSDFKNDISIDFFNNPYSKEWQWLTLLNNKSQKGIAIKELKNVLNLENHEIIVFGDNLNDYSMFKVANRAYAVKNAKDELKKIATKVIGYSDDDSVLEFILEENNIIYK